MISPLPAGYDCQSTEIGIADFEQAKRLRRLGQRNVIGLGPALRIGNQVKRIVACPVDDIDIAAQFVVQNIVIDDVTAVMAHRLVDTQAALKQGQGRDRQNTGKGREQQEMPTPLHDYRFPIFRTVTGVQATGSGVSPTYCRK
jgi:hypothetical protein